MPESFGYARLNRQEKTPDKGSVEDDVDQATCSSAFPFDEDLSGHEMDFRQPKGSRLTQGCGVLKATCRRLAGKLVKGAFGKWPRALLILIGYMGLVSGFIAISLTGKYHEFRKDISLNSFMVPNVPVSQQYSAYHAAQSQDKSHSSSLSISFFKDTTKYCHDNDINNHRRQRRQAIPYRYEKRQRKLMSSLNLVYLAIGNDTNMLTKEKLQVVHAFEKQLMRHPDYEKHCYISKLSLGDPYLKQYGNCTPPYSITAFFFASDNGQFDNLGDNMRPLTDTLNFLNSKQYFYKFVSPQYDPDKRYSNILRAQVLFGRPVEGIALGGPQKTEFTRYLHTYIKELEEFSSNEVAVLYGGGNLFDYLVEQALYSDLHLALISLILIIILLLLLTFSLWLTLVAILSIVSSVAVAYFFYHVVFGVKYMGILNGVSLFVIIGIGVDDIFVFINTFRQAVDNKDLGDRICHTITVAGKATFFTSFTTAAAFGANALSPIPAIHDFGLFMAILVTSCWVSVLFIMSPSLVLWNSGIEFLETAFCHKVLLVCGWRKNERLRLPDDIRQFLSGMTHTNALNQDDDDSENSNVALQTLSIGENDDDELLVIENRLSPEAGDSDTLGFRLQSILYHFVAQPVVKGRYVILAISVILLAVSVFLVTKLQVSTEQPKFFKAGTNLQRWLELPEVSFRPSHEMVTDILTASHGRIQSTSKPSVTTKKPGTKRHTTRQPITNKPPLKSTTQGPARSTNQPTTPFRLTTRRATTQRTTLKQITKRTARTTQDDATTQPLPTTGTTQKAREAVTSDINSVGVWNTTISSVEPTERPLDACEQKKGYCGSYGICKAVNGSATCTCQQPYTGDTCRVYCPVRTMSGNCCVIPFKYHNVQQFGCLIDETRKESWCSLTNDYDTHKIKGICNTTVENKCIAHTKTPNKTCCVFPFVYKMVQYYYCNLFDEYGNEPVCGTQRNPVVLHKCDLKPQPTDTILCPTPNSCKTVKKPPDGTNAMVYVVFGILGLDDDSVDRRHVLEETEGSIKYDARLPRDLSCDRDATIRAICKICIKIAKNKELVYAAECFPSKVRKALAEIFPDDCGDLPLSVETNGKRNSLVITEDYKTLKWFSMAFESTTGKLTSFTSQQKDFMKWEKFIKSVLSDETIPDSLKSGFQTSETWVKMYSGMIVVESAVYGIVVSLVLCLAAVIIFTGHAMLFLILFLTILGVLLKVSALFYLTGWQLGGVEALSVSILVGTSVDYCFHLVEGYILAGEAVNPATAKNKSRQWRSKAAMSHIGMSIISSAITTILAAIPLCLAQIQLFAKFGLIVTINTGISLLYTVTVTMAMLSTFGPARFRASIRACVMGAAAVAVLSGLVILTLYLISTKQGVCIPSPQGTPLFDCQLT